MAEVAERRSHKIATVGVAGVLHESIWSIATMATDGIFHEIRSREIDGYMNQASPPISRQDFLARAEGWVRQEDMEKLYLEDFREALGRLVSILLHRHEEAPEKVLKEKGIL
ncbi:hypothetical protein HYS84_00150 [Candidatus Saccharibacteria bacterium]|nr:hypothetical protein [Candidatus Saccharibacteria bacterium]